MLTFKISTNGIDRLCQMTGVNMQHPWHTRFILKNKGVTIVDSSGVFFFCHMNALISSLIIYLWGQKAITFAPSKGEIKLKREISGLQMPCIKHAIIRVIELLFWSYFLLFSLIIFEVNTDLVVIKQVELTIGFYWSFYRYRVEYIAPWKNAIVSTYISFLSLSLFSLFKSFKC